MFICATESHANFPHARISRKYFGIPVVDQSETQYRIDKNREEKKRVVYISRLRNRKALLIIFHLDKIKVLTTNRI